MQTEIIKTETAALLSEISYELSKKLVEGNHAPDIEWEVTLESHRETYNERTYSTLADTITVFTTEDIKATIEGVVFTYPQLKILCGEDFLFDIATSAETLATENERTD